jgi:hypothetical protein
LLDFHGRNPRVTVAMTCRNAESSVGDAIESVLAQEFRDFELIVCDDASLDRTARLARSYSDHRIRHISNSRRLGDCASRNKLLDAARGQFVIYLDGDDHAYPQGIGFMAEMLSRFPKAGFACARPASQKFIYPVELSPHDYCACAFLGPSVFASDMSQLMFRTASLRGAGGFNARTSAADAEIQLTVGRRQSCVLINNGLVWWRRPAAGTGDVPPATETAVQFARFAHTALKDGEWPLSRQELSLARCAVDRSAVRAIASVAINGHLSAAARLLRLADIPAAAWARCLSSAPREHFEEISGINPLQSGIGTPAKALPPAVVRVRAMHKKLRMRSPIPKAADMLN